MKFKLPHPVRNKFLGLGLVLLLCSFLTGQVLAQSAAQINVAPARQELVADPGEITAVQVRFYNPTEAPISGLLRVTDFIVERDDGVPSFLETGEASPRFAAASWVTLPYDRITVAAQESVSIEAKIRVPQNASPGGRYFAVYFEHGSASPQLGNEEEKSVAITHRVASLIYLTIAGPVEETALLKELKTPTFLEYGPIGVETSITNQGNLHIRPQGTLTLTNMLGKVIDQQQLEEKNVFPDVSRTFENTLGQDKRWLIGKYRIDLSATYGDSGKVLAGTVFTWVFPWKLAAMVVLAVIIASLLITLTLRSFRRKEAELEEKIEQLEEKINPKS